MTRMAAIQMNSSNSIAENLQTAEMLIAEAASQGAALAVLPEMFAIMGKTAQDKVNAQEQLGQGPIQDHLTACARKYHMWLVTGTIPIASAHENKVYATSLLINSEGQIVSRYDKIHLFDVQLSDQEKYQESETTAAGNEIVISPTPFGQLGLSVCYDIRFPEMFRKMSALGAEILLVPAAFTYTTGKAHWEVLLRSRAIENFCYVIAAAQCGKHADGRSTYGHSMIINPWGEIIAEQQTNQPGIISAEIDLAKLHEIRRKMPVHEHRKM